MSVGQTLVLKNLELWKSRGVCGHKGKHSDFEYLRDYDKENDYLLLSEDTICQILNIEHVNDDIIVYFPQYDFSAIFGKAESFIQFKVFLQPNKIWQSLNA